MKHFGKTPPFRGPDGEVLPGSIAEIQFRRLGGIDQWVMIRGESLDNPPLILLHGGPGMTEMCFFRHFNAPLEKSFTVVNWDQRGAGRSYHPGIPRSSMTVEQFIADLDELVEAVRHRVGKERVAIFGHSWGSALGVLYAARFPAKVAAYVGSGQCGDCPASERASYAFVLTEAERRHNDKAVKQLRAIGPPPYSAEQLWVQRTWLARLDGQTRLREVWKLGRAALGGPESSVFDLPNSYRGWRFSLDAMWAEVSALNLVRAVPALKMPIFFFLGRRDHYVPAETSVAYFEVLRAPSKKLVWFEQSGHEPFVDEPGRFNTLMVELVRPVCGEGLRGPGRELQDTSTATYGSPGKEVLDRRPGPVPDWSPRGEPRTPQVGSVP
jgi:pimeloyl-ACP methyl ester carboxylesterase